MPPTRRNFLKGTAGVTAGGAVAGCGSNQNPEQTQAQTTRMQDTDDQDPAQEDPEAEEQQQQPQELTTVEPVLPLGTFFTPMFQWAEQTDFFEAYGIDFAPQWAQFGTYVNALTQNQSPFTQLSFVPHINHINRGENFVMFPGGANFLGVNGVFTRADSDIESLEDLEGSTFGHVGFGSSAVQSTQMMLSELAGLSLRQDMQPVEAPPPALLGLLDNGDVDAVVEVSSFTLRMTTQPDKYKKLATLNGMWEDLTGHPLQITTWTAREDWYNQNSEIAAALLRGSWEVIHAFRSHTAELLQQYGEAGNITTQAQIDTLSQWADDNLVFLSDSSTRYDRNQWEFLSRMEANGFIDAVPPLEDVYRYPLEEHAPSI